MNKLVTLHREPSMSTTDFFVSQQMRMQKPTKPVTNARTQPGGDDTKRESALLSETQKVILSITMPFKT